MYSSFIFDDGGSKTTLLVPEFFVIEAEYLHIWEGIMLEYLCRAIVLMMALFKVN